jgi:hypothetical protein
MQMIPSVRIGYKPSQHHNNKAKEGKGARI